jgi:hypothetical protein
VRWGTMAPLRVRVAAATLFAAGVHARRILTETMAALF